MGWSLAHSVALCLGMVPAATSALTFGRSGLHDPVGSVQGLISRVLGAQYVAAIDLVVVPADPASGHDIFEVDSVGGRVTIRGNTGYSLAAGLNWWLKYTANCSVSWGRDGTGNQVALPPPASLPLPPSRSRVVAPVRARYAYNVCTFGYTMAWWNWTQFEQEVDRLALWGVNLPLAFQGQEYTWDRFYRNISSPLNESELAGWFAGPAFLPWNRMGNMQGWGGPLTPSWHAQQHALQVAIVTRMREFGMVPVLPGFAGHVPRTLAAHYPGHNFTDSPDWANFPEEYGSDALLEPTDPLFLTLGAQFNAMMLEDYGDPTGKEHPVFNADMFNEMEPNSADPAYLAACNAATYAAMTAANSNAVYMMQGWLFLDSFWTYDRVKAYLSGVPIGKLIILDLFSESTPLWQNFDSYFGHDWIWNALMVFGGRRGIYGFLDALTTQPYIDMHKPNVTMMGVGITPEATEMIPHQFDLAMEAGWRSGPVDAAQWMAAWAVRRYGGFSAPLDAATTTLVAAALNANLDEATLEDTPSITDAMSRNTNATGVLEALRLYVLAAPDLPPGAAGTFSYDLTDLHRQFLIDLFSDAHGALGGRFMAGGSAGGNTTASVVALVALCRNIMSTLDAALAADPNFLLGNWVADAVAWGAADPDPAATPRWSFNARTQVTMWGPAVGELDDYGAGFSGTVQSAHDTGPHFCRVACPCYLCVQLPSTGQGYYLPRWGVLFDAMVAAAASATPVNLTAVAAATAAWEAEWGANVTDRPPTQPSGADPVALAQASLAEFAAWDAAAWTAVADTDVYLPPPPHQFVHVGQDGYAAVSGDCPYLEQVDDVTLSGCEASCLSDSACNAINYNTPQAVCVHRQCQDPLHPQLSPGYAGWDYYGLNTTGGSCLTHNAWHRDLGVLATLCGADPTGCAAFSSAGNLYSCATKTVAAPGVVLYVRASRGGGDSASVAP